MRRCLSVIIAVTLAAGAVAHEVQGGLPLGDGKTSSTPQRGYVMTCPMRPPPGGGGGAQRSGDWITNGLWLPERKPVVDGSVSWPAAALTITVEGDRRVIRANGLPRHPTGSFPIQPGSQAFEYDRNPNHIADQKLVLSLPATPQIQATPTCIPMGPVGIAVSGAAIFNAFDAMGRDAPAYEIQDRCGGHPERSGRYHYHNWSPCLTGGRADEPVGWMLDGFPILGPVDDSGRPVSNADLDVCHGRVGMVRLNGTLIETYHYRFTREYPYSIGCFRGAVDASLLRPQGGPPNGGMGPPPDRLGPPPGQDRPPGPRPWP